MTEVFWREDLPIRYEPDKTYPIRMYDLIEFLKKVKKQTNGTIIAIEIDYEGHNVLVLTN